MFKNTFSSDTEFKVLIDSDLELGKVQELSYRLDSKRKGSIISEPDKFVSGGFRFTDLDTDLIYRLCNKDRFSTILVDGDRVFDEDKNGLKKIVFKILIPIEAFSDAMTPIDEEIMSVPISILGVQVSTPLYHIQIGEYYRYRAQSVIFVGSHRDKLFSYSVE